MAEKAKKEESVSYTYEGVEITIGMEQIDDVDLFEDIVEAQGGNEVMIVPIMRRLLGDNYAAVKSTIKEKCGRVSVKEMVKIFEGLMAKVGESNPN